VDREKRIDMFTAIVLACVIGMPDKCITAEDTRGPYKTEQECVMRAYEMITGMQMIFPVPHMYRYKCTVEGLPT
jgi:hypothetical protein